MKAILEKSYPRQKGMSVIPTLVVFAMAGLIMLCGLKIAPSYMDNAILKKAMEAMDEERGLASMNESEIRRNLARTLITNNIRNFDTSNVVLVKGGKDTTPYVLVNYESRVPLLYNLEAVVVFKNRFDL